MTDYLAIGLTHFLILVACWRLLSRKELDREGPGIDRQPVALQQTPQTQEGQARV